MAKIERVKKRIVGTTPNKLLVTDINNLPTSSTLNDTDLVVGPASATDSAIALFDTTTGKLLKNSATTISTSASANSSTQIMTSDAVQTAIANQISAKKTVITIAHKFSSIVNSDRIIFIKDKEIIEQGSHQHLLEIRQSISQLQPQFSHNLNFVPWRGDFTRGIFISSVLKTEFSIEELYELYAEYYKNHPFTILSRESIDLKMVVNTNKCLIQIEKQGDYIAIHSCIDNLLKGASGQAVQNMNLMFGLSETSGLRLKSPAF